VSIFSCLADSKKSYKKKAVETTAKQKEESREKKSSHLWGIMKMRLREPSRPDVLALCTDSWAVIC
jgi:hypothetical protein